MTLLIANAEKALNEKQDQLNIRWYPRYHLAPRAVG